MCFGLWFMLLQTGAQAEWVELEQNETAAFSYDPSLIEMLPDGKVSVWIKVGASPKSKLTQIWEAEGYGPYPYSLSRRIIDCSTRQNATSSIRYYTTDGKKISEKNHSPWEFKDIVPGTIGNQLADLICKKSQRMQ